MLILENPEVRRAWEVSTASAMLHEMSFERETAKETRTTCKHFRDRSLAFKTNSSFQGDWLPKWGFPRRRVFPDSKEESLSKSFCQLP